MQELWGRNRIAFVALRWVRIKAIKSITRLRELLVMPEACMKLADTSVTMT